MDHKRNYRKDNQVDKNLFQFEMGNELGAELEEDKALFKNEYAKNQLQNNLRKLNDQQNQNKKSK